MATTYADPVGNGALTAWTNTWTNVDDAVRDPTDGDNAIISSSTDEATEDIVFGNTITYTAGATWNLKIRGAGGSKRAIDLQVSVNDGTSWDARREIIGANAAEAWVTVDISSLITGQTTLDQLRARFICNSTAGGGGASAVSIDATYVEQIVSEATNLVIQDAVLAVVADNIILSASEPLFVQDAAIAVAFDNLVLVPDLIIQDAVIGVTAENVILTLPPVDLVVQDAALAIVADNLVLDINTQLVVQDAALTLTVDNVVLVPDLAIQDAGIATVADNIVLTAFPPSGTYAIAPTGTLLLTKEWQTIPLTAYSWDNTVGILSRISARMRIRQTTIDSLTGRVHVRAYVDGVLALEGSITWPHLWERGPNTYTWRDLARIGVDDDVWTAIGGSHTFSIEARLENNKKADGVYLDVELIGQSLEVV